MESGGGPPEGGVEAPPAQTKDHDSEASEREREIFLRPTQSREVSSPEPEVDFSRRRSGGFLLPRATSDCRLGGSGGSGAWGATGEGKQEQEQEQGQEREELVLNTSRVSDESPSDDAMSIASRLSRIVVEEEFRLLNASCEAISSAQPATRMRPRSGSSQLEWRGGVAGAGRLLAPPSSASSAHAHAHAHALARRRASASGSLGTKQPKSPRLGPGAGPSHGGGVEESRGMGDRHQSLLVPLYELPNEATQRLRAQSVSDSRNDSSDAGRHPGQTGSDESSPQSSQQRENSSSISHATGASLEPTSQWRKGHPEVGVVPPAGRLHISRSTWTLSDFEATFKPSDESSELPDGSLSLNRSLGGRGSRNKLLVLASRKSASARGGVAGAGAANEAAREKEEEQKKREEEPAAEEGRASKRSHFGSGGLRTDSVGSGALSHAHSLVSVASSCDTSNGPRLGSRINSRPKRPRNAKRAKNSSTLATSGGEEGDSEASNGLETRFAAGSGDTGRKKTSFARCCFTLGALQRCFPILDWLPRYKLGLFWQDLVAGLVVAALNIPTSLSAAVVAETELSVAFRASIVNTFVYGLLTTSNHVSFGSWSIMSQMLLVSVQRALSDELILNRLKLGVNIEPSEYEKWHLNIIIMDTFLIGLVQLTCGLLKLGNILASFIPEALCSAMISATAFTMAMSQLANMCGTSNKILWSIEKNSTDIWVDLSDSPSDITDMFADLFRWAQEVFLLIKYHEQVNFICLIISIACVSLLFLNQYFLQVQLEKLSKRKILIPFEMLLLIVMVLISYALDLNKTYHVKTCTEIYITFDIPNLPNLKLIRELWHESLATALISFTMVYTMAKTYSNKLNYEIDCNQELVACGAGNLVGGLFDTLPATASFSRTAGQVEAGGQTQMASFVNCLVLTLIANSLGHHVAALPVCVMAATLFYGFIRMTTRVVEVFKYWRTCKVDFAIWLVTFAAILTIDLVQGFVYGFLFSLMTMLYRAQNRRCYLLGTVGTADVYVPIAKYPAARELEGIKIFQYCGPVNYACADLFERLLRRRTQVNVKEILKQNNGLNLEHPGWTNKVNSRGEQRLPSHIILDFSMISYIDSAGLGVIKKVIEDHQKIFVTVFIASPASHVASVIKRDLSLWNVYKKHFYVALVDAIHCAIRQRQLTQQVFQLNMRDS